MYIRGFNGEQSEVNLVVSQLQLRDHEWEYYTDTVEGFVIIDPDDMAAVKQRAKAHCIRLHRGRPLRIRPLKLRAPRFKSDFWNKRKIFSNQKQIQ